MSEKTCEEEENGHENLIRSLAGLGSRETRLRKQMKNGMREWSTQKEVEEKWMIYWVEMFLLAVLT
jgi:hypothetical protein